MGGNESKDAKDDKKQKKGSPTSSPTENGDKKKGGDTSPRPPQAGTKKGDPAATTSSPASPQPPDDGTRVAKNDPHAAEPLPFCLELSAGDVAAAAFNWSQPPIDSGGFSSIYAGKYYGHDVVIKSLTMRNQTEHEMFLEELGVLRNPAFQHPNLVPLMAFCVERPALIFPRLRPMKQDRMQRLPLDVREAIAVDACRGIEHMHSKGFVHRDLKADNVLLHFDENRMFVKALISDMGCARPTNVPIQPFGTMLYMDPQLYQQMAANVAVCPLPASDVFALGLTIACILTARPAHQPADFALMMDEIERHDVGRAKLLRSMTAVDANSRPTAKAALDEFLRLRGVPRQGGTPAMAAQPYPPATGHPPQQMQPAPQAYQQQRAPPPQGYQQQPPAHPQHYQQQPAAYQQRPPPQQQPPIQQGVPQAYQQRPQAQSPVPVQQQQQQPGKAAPGMVRQNTNSSI